MTAAETGAHFEEVVFRVQGGEGRVIVERDGALVAAVVSALDLEYLDLIAQRYARGFEALNEIGRAFQDVPEDEIEREVAKALAEVRAEMRAEREQERQRLAMQTP